MSAHRDIFWCGIGAPGLEALAAETDAAAASLGVELENRAFSPHLTLARIKDRVDLRPLFNAIAGIPVARVRASSRRGPSFCIAANCAPAGSVYTKLAEFPFSKR